METLEDLRAIIAGKPKGATHHSKISDVYFVKGCTYGWMLWSYIENDWIKSEVSHDLRSLSDIERIIDLVEFKENVKDIIRKQKRETKK